MKNKVKYLLLLILLLPISSKAASASISCSGGGTVAVGRTVTVRFSGNYSGDNKDLSMWRASGVDYTSSVVNLTSSNGTIVQDGGLSVSYTFKATNVGSTQVKLVNVDVADVNQLIGPGGVSNSCTINVVSSTSSTNVKNTKTNTENKETINSLNSLSISGIENNIEFDKEKLEYNLEVENNIDKINIEASTTSSKSTVTGIGEKELAEGLNSFNIVVTSESGSARIYVINITRKELNPIKVSIDGKEYTLIRKKDILSPPDGFEETTVNIDNQDVLAYKNKKFTIVGLTDEYGTSLWYIYDKKNNTYTKFMVFNSDLKLMLLNADKKKQGFKIEEITVRGQKIKAYVSNVNSSFIVVKALNITTNIEGLFLYDKRNDSFIMYDSEAFTPKIKKFNIDSIYSSIKNSGLNYSIYYIIGGCCLFLIVVILFISLNNRKLKRKIKVYKNKENDEELISGDTKFLDKFMDKVDSTIIEDETKIVEDEVEHKEENIENDNVNSDELIDLDEPLSLDTMVINTKNVLEATDEEDTSINNFSEAIDIEDDTFIKSMKQKKRKNNKG